MKIYVASKGDAEAVAVILLRAGYEVRITSEKEAGKTKARTVVYANIGKGEQE